MADMTRLTTNDELRRYKDAIEATAINAERKRCYDIVMAARMGSIDNDLRSILHRIQSGDSVTETSDD